MKLEKESRAYRGNRRDEVEEKNFQFIWSFSFFLYNFCILSQLNFCRLKLTAISDKRCRSCWWCYCYSYAVMEEYYRLIHLFLILFVSSLNWWWWQWWAFSCWWIYYAREEEKKLFCANFRDRKKKKNCWIAAVLVRGFFFIILVMVKLHGLKQRFTSDGETYIWKHHFAVCFYE